MDALDTIIFEEFQVKELVGSLLLKSTNTRKTRKCTIEIKARFRCTHCKKDWTSANGTVLTTYCYNKRDAVVEVRAHAYRQKCKKCRTMGQIRPYLDDYGRMAGKFLEYFVNKVVFPQ